MRKCFVCHREIPETRLRALPDTTTCVGCSTVTPLQGVMTWEHKTAPTIVLGTKEELADLRRFQRRGVHAQLPMTSKSNARVVASAELLGKFESLRGRQRDGELDPSADGGTPTAVVVINERKARCHPDRTAVADGKCFECALAWYAKRRR
jgi:DksA/TraR C4-type zinc finger protein